MLGIGISREEIAGAKAEDGASERDQAMSTLNSQTGSGKQGASRCMSHGHTWG